MNIEELRNHCIKKLGVEEGFPFDQSTLVFKVMGKMFALTGLEAERPSVNLKCDPDWSVQLREQYQAVIPGYHMNKKHWNTVYLDSDLSNTKIKELIDHSYDLIVASLPRKKQKELEGYES